MHNESPLPKFWNAFCPCRSRLLVFPDHHRLSSSIVRVGPSSGWDESTHDSWRRGGKYDGQSGKNWNALAKSELYATFSSMRPFLADWTFSPTWTTHSHRWLKSTYKSTRDRLFDISFIGHVNVRLDSVSFASDFYFSVITRCDFIDRKVNFHSLYLPFLHKIHNRIGRQLRLFIGVKQSFFGEQILIGCFFA